MADPPAEAVDVGPGGSTDWGAMTPGQRRTFVDWARGQGYEPCGTFSYYSSDPPELCQTDPARVALGATDPLLAKSGLFDLKAEYLVYAALALLALLVVTTLAARGARRLAPV